MVKTMARLEWVDLLERYPDGSIVRARVTPASQYGSRVVGVILSGANQDGAAGMRPSKITAGLPLVQDPVEAKYPQMPAAFSADAPKLMPVAELARQVAAFCSGQP